MQVRWDRIIAVLLILLLPVVLPWLANNMQVGDFSQVPILGAMCEDREMKALLLLGVVLVGFVGVVTIIRGGARP